MGDIKSEIKKLINKAPKSLASRRFLFWKDIIVRVSVVFSATAVVAVLGLSAVNDALALYKPDVSATVTASSNRELADELFENGIIDHPNLFYLYAELNGKKELDGEQTISVNSDMDYRQLLRTVE